MSESNKNQNFFKKSFHKARRVAAKYWYKLYEPYTIAVTGSQGKTNTTTLLASLMPKALRTDINLDTLYNVPITALKIKKAKQLCIFELGIDKPQEMSLHLEIVKPNISIVTGISPVHTDANHLGSLENIIKEKRKIVEVLTQKDYAILNYDGLNVRDMAKFTKAKVLFYGSNPKFCQVYTNANLTENTNYSIDLKGTKFSIFDKDDPSKEIRLSTKLIGIHHVSNIMASYLAFKTVNQNSKKPDSNWQEKFVEVIENQKPLEGRMNIEKGPQGMLVLNDSLRANIESTKFGLKTFNEIKGTTSQKIAIIGEMGEIGENEIKIHEELGDFIADQRNINYIIGIGPLLQNSKESAIKNGLAPSKFFWAKDITIAATILQMICKKGDFIYLKGSRLRHMERLTMVLDGKSVGCNVINCPLYNHCSKCKFLQTGYKEES